MLASDLEDHNRSTEFVDLLLLLLLSSFLLHNHFWANFLIEFYMATGGEFMSSFMNSVLVCLSMSVSRGSSDR